MHFDYLFAALLLGIVVAIPPGSVTIIACQRALKLGFKNSIFFTIGSSVSDIFYLCLVYFGVANVIANNNYLKIGLWFISGIVLLLISIISLLSIIRKSNVEKSKYNFQSNRLSTVISGILITLSNPMTIVGWIVVAGNFYLIWNDKYPDIKRYGLLTVTAIMLGVLIWFIPLTLIISKIGKMIKEQMKNILIIIGNTFLIGFGFLAFFYAIKEIIKIRAV
jgi:threonine/homoserine/homoserine lactone efflux protein